MEELHASIETILAERPSISTILDTLLQKAHLLRASDIHMDPTSTHLRVRVRIDGALHELCRIPKEFHGEIISRIKVLTRLRTDEHYAAQDGRFRQTLAGEVELDVRVSITPTYHGENAVLRLLLPRQERETLDSLGFSAANQEKILHAISRPHGMLLATGPTGSGKTTTLYSLVQSLTQDSSAVVTIEDPIEYAMEGVRQIPVEPRSGLTFAQGLRSLLRQDPNTIMVGEIRDGETASIAVNTALTGHLLLSTLHTKSASAAIPRLLDMGTDAYLIASTLTLVIGQRLLRKLCPLCKEAYSVGDAETTAIEKFLLSSPPCVGEFLYRAVGCTSCGGTGFRGRLCAAEVLSMNETLTEAIMRKAPLKELETCARSAGMTPLIEDAFEKVRQGETSLQEALRIAYE